MLLIPGEKQRFVLLRRRPLASWSRRGSKLYQFLALVIPDSQHAVQTAGDDRLTVAAGGGRIHILARAAEVALAVAVGRIDQPYLGIATAGDHHVVGHKADAGHFLRELILDRADLVSRPCVPDLEH